MDDQLEKNMTPLNKVKRNYPAYFIYKSQKLFF